MITFLLEQRGANVIIIEKMMKTTTKNSDNEKNMMMFLFEQHEADVIIIEKMIKIAAKNEKTEKKK